MHFLKKTWVKYTLSYLIALLVLFLVYYVTLPAINLRSPGFYFFLTLALFLFMLPISLFKRRDVIIEDSSASKARSKKKKNTGINPDLARLFKKTGSSLRAHPFLSLALIPVAVLLIGSIISSPFFNARRYAAIIDVEEAVFRDDMPESDTVTNIALMDSDSAAIVGSRTLGSLSHVVSQYEISESYTQINYRHTPKKVAKLEYAGFFKWLGNRASGIPGYVMVDPVGNTAEYVSYASAQKYSESGYFGDDLERRLRFDYPTKIFGSIRFEVDDEGRPVYVVSCMKPSVGLFGALDVNEVILFDPTTGESEIYGVHETPAWIDSVFDGDLAMEKYNWKGMYSGGFFNSVIGNKNCKVTTDDYGYIVIGDDVWYFTGVTSVNSDQSNIGFIISNARTGEYKFYPVIGAEEHSAMGAAEGEVQEKGYVASFPALINVKGEATYIMVLKDSGGLVKLYALVNVETYRLVATADTQEKAFKAYIDLLLEEGVLSESDAKEEREPISVLIKSISSYTVGGESYLYFGATYEGEEIFLKARLSSFEALLFRKEGDTLTVYAEETAEDGIYLIDGIYKP